MAALIRYTTRQPALTHSIKVSTISPRSLRSVVSSASQTTQPFPALYTTRQPTSSFSTTAATGMPADSHAHATSNKGNTDDASVNEDWKTRPPYQIHTKHEDFPVRYEASCHCGSVKYQLSREKPLDSKLCHCTTCQTQHAAPFQWAAIFHKTDINFTHGHHSLEWYDPSEKTTRHKLPCKVRCNYCHSPIMDEGRNMVLLFPSLIHFKSREDRMKFDPKCHMFYGQRVMDIPDGKPKWEGLNGESKRLDDVDPIHKDENYTQG